MKERNSFHFGNMDYFMWIQTGSLMWQTKLVAIRLKGALSRLSSSLLQFTARHYFQWNLTL